MVYAFYQINVSKEPVGQRIRLDWWFWWVSGGRCIPIWPDWRFKGTCRSSSQSWKLKRPQIQLRPHHFWTYTSNLTTVVNSVLKFMINGTTSILKSYIFQICASIYQLPLHMVFTSRNWFVMQGPVAIILISWNVIFIWETGYWTRAIKRFALFDLLKSLYSDTKFLSKYISSL